VLSLQDTNLDQNEHLWSADLISGERRRITNGTSTETTPAVSPDGKMLLFTQVRVEYMLMSVSLENAEAKRIVTSELEAGMPAWAMRQEKFAYTTNRGGAAEIWLRGDGAERPLVTQDMFPAGTTNSFMVPALSPEADRVVYSRVDSQVGALNWISSVGGGPPVRLSNESGYVEFGGSWSPDGRNFAFLRCKGGSCDVAIAKTSGEAAPVRLCESLYGLPQWSPDGQWIKFSPPGGDGWSLISPDGKTVRAIGMKEAIELTFSLDSKTLYGFRPDAGRAQLFSLDLRSNAVKTIGFVEKEEYPGSLTGPGIRLSLSPDGKSILYPAVRGSRSLWMLGGF
jgi:Tol biopolymer transport system component